MSKPTTSSFAERYLVALRSHLKRIPTVSLSSANALGREAVTMRLETLAVAKIHDLALAGLLGPDLAPFSRATLTNHAVLFFTESITPIEETHRAARKATADLLQLNAALIARTHDLAASSDELKHEIANRATAEAALESSRLSACQLLKDSQALEASLQDMAHRILSATEAERKRMSLQLNDEIAQTLLGISFRMEALKQQVSANQELLALEIALAQRVVEDSSHIIHRLTHEFSKAHG